jgi:hypothetical protein
MKTHCRKGHPLNAKTTYLDSPHYNGKRYTRCRRCHAIKTREWRIRQIPRKQPPRFAAEEVRP